MEIQKKKKKHSTQGEAQPYFKTVHEDSCLALQKTLPQDLLGNPGRLAPAQQFLEVALNPSVSHFATSKWTHPLESKHLFEADQP